MKLGTFYPPGLRENIEKAVRFIKADQFHAGFTEISHPEKGGTIEVLIKPNENDNTLFHVVFRYLTTPGHQTILTQEKDISYSELMRLSSEYDKNKDRIDTQLSYQSEVPSP